MSTQEPSKIVTAKICPRCSREFSPAGTVNICPHDQSLLSLVTSDPFIGQVIAGHYRVTDVLGQGGWSVVYRAQHETIKNRQVAIKMLHSHLIRDKDKVLRFQREAEAAMSLNFPQIAAVYDYGVLPEGQPFIVMEYLDGVALSEVLKEQGALSTDRALTIAKQVCLGLAAAHDRRIIHRDVKPSNIFLTKDENGNETVKLLDFGLAKIISPEPGEGNLTHTGDTMGTPDYMSPEQCIGLELDARTDIYTFGYVLYEMLTGKQAVRGKNTYESMNMHIHETPLQFAEANPQCAIAPAIEAVVFKTLAKNPDDRYQTAMELRDALERAAEQKEQTLTMFSRMLAAAKLNKRIAKARKKKSSFDPVVIVAAAASLLLLTGIGMKVVELNSQKSQQSQKAVHNPAEAWKALNAQGINAYNDSDYVAARSYFEQAEPVGGQLGDDSEQHRITLNYLKDTYSKLGQNDLAAKVAAKMEAIQQNYYYSDYGRKEENDALIRKLFRDLLAHPNDKKIATELSATLNKQAALAIIDSRLDEAAELVDQAMDLSARVLGKDSAEYGKSVSNLAAVTFDTGKRTEAEPLYKQALSVREKALGPDDPLVGRSCRNLAEYYRRLQRYNEAIPLLNRALQIYERNPGKKHQDYAWTANNLGITYLANLDLSNAEKWLNVALGIRAEINGQEHPDYARVLCNLGQLNCARKNYAVAERQIKDSMVIFENKIGPTKVEYGLSALNLGTVYAQMNQPILAEKYLKRALTVLSALDPRGDRTAAAFQGLVQVYMSQNKIDDARALTRDMGAINAKETQAAEASHPIDMR